MKKAQRGQKKKPLESAQLEVINFIRREGLEKLQKRFNVIVKRHGQVFVTNYQNSEKKLLIIVSRFSYTVR